MTAPTPELTNLVTYGGGTLLTILLAAGIRSMFKRNGPKPAGQQSVEFWQIKLMEAQAAVKDEVVESMKPCFDRQEELMKDIKTSTGEMREAARDLLISSQRRRSTATE